MFFFRLYAPPPNTHARTHTHTHTQKQTHTNPFCVHLAHTHTHKHMCVFISFFYYFLFKPCLHVFFPRRLTRTACQVLRQGLSCWLYVISSNAAGYPGAKANTSHSCRASIWHQLGNNATRWLVGEGRRSGETLLSRTCISCCSRPRSLRLCFVYRIYFATTTMCGKWQKKKMKKKRLIWTHQVKSDAHPTVRAALHGLHGCGCGPPPAV